MGLEELNETPQEFFRLGSVRAASPGIFETRFVWEKEMAQTEVAFKANNATNATSRITYDRLIVISFLAEFSVIPHGEQLATVLIQLIARAELIHFLALLRIYTVHVFLVLSVSV